MFILRIALFLDATLYHIVKLCRDILFIRRNLEFDPMSLLFEEQIKIFVYLTRWFKMKAQQTVSQSVISWIKILKFWLNFFHTFSSRLDDDKSLLVLVICWHIGKYTRLWYYGELLSNPKVSSKPALTQFNGACCTSQRQVRLKGITKFRIIQHKWSTSRWEMTKIKWTDARHLASKLLSGLKTCCERFIDLLYLYPMLNNLYVLWIIDIHFSV